MTESRFLGRLRRDLGALESYALLIGMLVGAGIFRVTSVASERTGASVVLGYLALAPAVFASSVAYAVFLSTRLGDRPGGELESVGAVFGPGRVAFLCAWLKLIAYLGALAFLGQTLADYLVELGAVLGLGESGPASVWLTLGLLTAFLVLHLSGVRWFGRVQVAMCLVLGVSILVLVLPGLFAIERESYAPLFPHGAKGFLRALPPLFFAFAGFEVIAHTAGEVKDSRDRLPRAFLVGILTTTVIFVSMSAVAFGVMPAAELAANEAPMAAAAQRYLPAGAAALVALGGVFAVATSVNGTLIVPARVTLVLARAGRLPAFLGHVHAGTGAPVTGLLASFAISAFLLLSGQLTLALNVAVFSLVLVYLANSIALLCLPRRNPELYATARTRVPRRVQVVAALVSIALLGVMVVVQLIDDVGVLRSTTLGERFSGGSLTCLELVPVWCLVGLGLYSGDVGDSGESA